MVGLSVSDDRRVHLKAFNRLDTLLARLATLLMLLLARFTTVFTDGALGAVSAGAAEDEGFGTQRYPGGQADGVATAGAGVVVLDKFWLKVAGAGWVVSSPCLGHNSV